MAWIVGPDLRLVPSSEPHEERSPIHAQPFRDIPCRRRVEIDMGVIAGDSAMALGWLDESGRRHDLLLPIRLARRKDTSSQSDQQSIRNRGAA